MADKKISELTALTGANTATDDQLVIVDTSAGLTKSITVAEFQNALDGSTGFVRITGDTMTGALDVQSTVTADGLNLDGNIQGDNGQNMQVSAGEGTGDKLDLRAGDDVRIYVDGATAHKLSANFANNGDISFYDSAGSSQSFYWDAADESLGIGTTAPQRELDVHGTGNVYIRITAPSATDSTALELKNTTQTWTLKNDDTDDNNFKIQNNDGTKFVIDRDTGDVGIGTSSPVTINGGSSLTGQNNSGFEFVAFRNDPAIAENDFVGAYLFGNNDASGAPNHYAGIWAEANDTFGAMDLQFAAGRTNYETNTPQMTILESGNVGIGTSSPNLHGWTTAVTLNTSSNGGYEIGQSGTKYGAFALQGDGRVQLTNFTANPLTFQTNNTERMRIDSSGNVIVGGTSAQASDAATLMADGEVTAAGFYFSNNIGAAMNDTGIRRATTNTMVFDTNSAEAMRIDSSGNLLVGKTSANTATAGVEARSSGLFSASRDGNTTAYFNRITSDGDIVGFLKDGTTVGSIGTAGGQLNIGLDTTSGLNFGTSIVYPRGTGNTTQDGTISLGNGSNRFKDLYLSGNISMGGRILDNTHIFANLANTTEYMRIDSSGNLLVGVTSSITAGSEGIELRGDLGYIKTGRNNTGAVGHFLFYNPNGNVGSITTSGSSTAFNTSSDYRLKENVVELTGATTRLKQLEPKRFNFIADADTTVDGFIAHEVQSVVPEAITGTHNEVDDEGNPVYQGIDQSKLVPLLVATIQELEARITALENA